MPFLVAYFEYNVVVVFNCTAVCLNESFCVYLQNSFYRPHMNADGGLTFRASVDFEEFRVRIGFSSQVCVFQTRDLTLASGLATSFNAKTKQRKG